MLTSNRYSFMGAVFLCALTICAHAQDPPAPAATQQRDETAAVEQNAPELAPTVLRRVRTEGAEDQVFYAPAGVERMRIDSDNGNVSVGTTGVAPATRLFVSENADVASILRIDNPNPGATASAMVRATSNTGTVTLAAHGSGRTSTARFGTALAGWSELLQTTGSGMILGTYGNAPVILGTNSANRLHIAADGRIGIGTSSPNRQLTVINTAFGTGGAIYGHYEATITSNTSMSDVSTLGAYYSRIAEGVTQSGNAYGIRGLSNLIDKGTLSAAYGVSSNVGIAEGAANTGTINYAFGLHSIVAKNSGNIVNGYGLYIGDVGATNDWGIYQSGADDQNFFAGSVTVGTSGATGTNLIVNGGASFTGTVTGGNIQAKYQDLAEWVPSNSDLPPGTVVVLDPALGNGVMASSASYDTTVAGVVSAQPGIILGEAGAAKEQVATTGRVRVRVDATAAPIRVGDLLVTSDKPGMAMRSEPMDIGGRKFHQPGTIIGKALESLEGGEGEILVLLSLQ